MKKKTLSRILLCFGAAALVLAAALFWFLPRQADDLLKIVDPDGVISLSIIYSSSSSGSMDSFTVNDEALVDEFMELLSRTTLHRRGYYGSSISYDDALYTVYLTPGSSTPIHLRPNGSVYCDGWLYAQNDDTLEAYMSLLPRLIEHANFTDEQLAAYQSLFETGSWYAQAVAAPFESLAPDLNAMFYDGLSYDADGQPVYGGYVTPEDGAEWDWVRANVPGGDELDVSRLPREGMLTVLRDVIYGEFVDIPDDLAPAGWTYRAETDCYYHAHGDTGINSVTLTSGHVTAGGRVLYFQNALDDTWCVYFQESQREGNEGHLYLRCCRAPD